MKSTDEFLLKILILRRSDGRQRSGFSARKKSFATSMSQKYGELAQVFRTGETFVHTASNSREHCQRKHRRDRENSIKGADVGTPQGQTAAE